MDKVLTKQIKLDENVLDAGCAANAYAGSIFIQAGFKNVNAIDINPEVGYLLSNNSESKGINFKEGSVLSIPFSEKLFDIVNCSGVIHHTPDPKKAINELSRVTKDDGTLIIGIYCLENSIFEYLVRLIRVIGFFIPYKLMHFLFKFSPAINNFVLDHMYVPILWLYSKDEIRSLLKKNKFEIIDEWVASFDCFYGKKLFGISWVNGGLLGTFVCKKT